MKHPRRAAVSSILVLVALGGCGGGERIVAPVPSNLTIASGNNQWATPGTALADPLEVSVTSPEGEPAAGVNVNWIVMDGAGTLSAVKTTTDEEGRASVNWTLGNKAGSQSVEAIVITVASPASFSATAAAPVVLR
jgi:Big-like domain-containing protein